MGSAHRDYVPRSQNLYRRTGVVEQEKALRSGELQLFGIWNLGFIWSLELGTWSFISRRRFFPPLSHEPNYGSDKSRDNHIVRLMRILLHNGPVVAQLHPKVQKKRI